MEPRATGQDWWHTTVGEGHENAILGSHAIWSCHWKDLKGHPVQLSTSGTHPCHQVIQARVWLAQKGFLEEGALS